LSTKIQRICSEIEKTKSKIQEQQIRLRDLERQKTEIENLEIVSAVRGMNISFADLAELLKQTKGSVSGTSGQVDPKSKTDTSALTQTQNDETEDEE